jgi:hypothetical protein
MTPGESEKVAGYVRGEIGKAEYQQREEVMPPDTTEPELRGHDTVEASKRGAATVPRSSDVAAGGESDESMAGLSALCARVRHVGRTVGGEHGEWCEEAARTIGRLWGRIEELEHINGSLTDPATPKFSGGPTTADVDADPDFVDGPEEVAAGGEPEREPYRGDTFQAIQSGNVMDPATWEYIPDPFTTAPGTNAEPAFHEPARIALDRLIAERDQWKDRCERLAELVEALEARIRILEESASQQSEKAE